MSILPTGINALSSPKKIENPSTLWNPQSIWNAHKISFFVMKIFFAPIANTFYHFSLKILLFMCCTSYVKLTKLAVAWTHKRAVGGIGLFWFYVTNWFTFKVSKTLNCSRLCDKIDNRPMMHLTAWSWVQMIASFAKFKSNIRAQFWVGTK